MALNGICIITGKSCGDGECYHGCTKLIPTFEVGPCNMTEAEIQDAIGMIEHGTAPQTAIMLAKQHE